MPWIEGRTGVVAPDGYEERQSGYQCDVPDCRREAVEPWKIGASLSGLCEEHVEEAKEADQMDERTLWEPCPECAQHPCECSIIAI